jgi:septation ring formation regulator EzrA
MGCEHECFNEHRIAELEDNLRKMQERQSDRNKEFYERIGELERKTALSENDLNHIKSTVDEMNNNLKILMAVPGKRYDTIIVCIITAVVGAVVGFMLSGVFPM